MKVLLFIGLKIVEILSLIFIPLYLGKLAKKFIPYFEDDDFPTWAVGFGVILIIGFIFLCCAANWELVNYILKDKV